MMKAVFYATLIIALEFAASCSKKCKGKRIHFGFVFGNKGENFKVYVEGKLRGERTLRENHLERFEDPRFRMFTLCASKDSLSVRVQVNSSDTSFYIYPRDIKECYISTDVGGGILIFYNYEQGGFREYSDDY